MSDQKYYVPAIEDLFIGYQCEARFIDSPDYETWHKVAIQSGGNNSIAFTMANAVSKSVELRTPFFTREDIEGEGWLNGWYDESVVNDASIYMHAYGKTLRDKCIFGCIYAPLSSHLLLTIKYKGDESKTVFAGKCKSINEFRKICKMVGIEKVTLHCSDQTQV